MRVNTNPHPRRPSPEFDFSPWRPNIAVLPFLANGNHPELLMLGRAVRYRLRDRLEREPALRGRVIQSARLDHSPPHALELLCRELHVGHLIIGKCHPTGRNPSLYVELAETRSWHVRWADFLVGGARQLLAAESPKMDAMVAALRTELLLHRAC